MDKNYDVAIIGGGIVGGSIAAHLAKKGLNIVLINTTNIGTPASIAAAGLLTPFQVDESGSTLSRDFSLKSFDYFNSFYNEICSYENIDFGFNLSGTLYLLFSNFEIANKELELKEFKDTTAKISFLTKQEISKLEPSVTKEIIGAYYIPQEGYLNNPKFLKAINKYLIEKKVTIINNTVTDINLQNNSIESITLKDLQKISAKKYILCNGAWANKLLNQVLNLKENLIAAIKGEIIQLEVKGQLPLNRILFCKEGYILPRPATNKFETNTILVGSTTEEVNVENSNPFFNSLKALTRLSNLFYKLLPNHQNCNLINQWCGLRPKTIDCLPILGNVDEIKNLSLALGHYRHGVLTAPYTGKIIADLITDNTCDFDISKFNINRFLKTKLDKALIS